MNFILGCSFLGLNVIGLVFCLKKGFLDFYSLVFMNMVIPALVFTGGYFFYSTNPGYAYQNSDYDYLYMLLMLNQFVFLIAYLVFSGFDELPAINISSLGEKVPYKPLLWIPFVALVVSVYIVGLSGVFWRDTYELGQDVQVKSLRALAEMMTTLSPLMLGFVYAKGNTLYKLGAGVVLVLYLFYFIGLTTRFVALFPFMFLIGFVFGGGRVKWYFFMLVLLLFPILLYVPINSRAMAYQGVLPVIEWISHGAPSQFFYDDDGVYTRMIGNFFHGYMVAFQTWYDWPNMDLSMLWISVNPLPGSMVGWYEIAPMLRVNMYVPYSTYGQLLAHGLVVILLFTIVLAFVFKSFDAFIRSDENPGLKVLVMICGLMFIVLSFQYNLRSSVRFLDIGIFVILTSWFWKKLTLKRGL